MNDSVYKSRITVVSLHQAILASGQQPHAPAQAQAANSGRNKKIQTLWVRAHFLIMIDEPAEPNMARRVAGCQLALEKDIIGSRGEDWAFEAYDKVYAQDGFFFFGIVSMV